MLALYVVLQKPLTAREVYDRSRPSVVSIEVTTPSGSKTGTGFFFEDGRTIVTCLHVLDDAKDITVSDWTRKRWQPDKIKFDFAADVALITLAQDSKRPGLPHGPSQSVRVGDPVYVIGDPLGLAATLSAGIVSGLRTRTGYETPLVQTTAAISHGSSGGPLIDQFGRAIGIVDFTFTDGQALNFGVSTKVAKWLKARSEDYTVPQFVELYRRIRAAKTEP